MQFKILEALECGVPVVAASLAKGDIIADEVVRIMETKNLQDTIEERAPQVIKKNYSWQRSNLIVEDIYVKK